MTQPIGRPLLIFTGLCICLAMLLGGGSAQGRWTDYVLYLVFAPFTLIGLGQIQNGRVSALAKILVGLILAVLLLQFLPIPNPVNPFQNANGEGPAGSALMAATNPGGWHFWSPDIGRSAESALFTISLLSFAIFIARLSDFDQARLARFFIAGLFLNVMIALVQTSFNNFDSSSLFFPYQVSVGIFANENHFSALIYCGVVLAGFQFIFLNKQNYLYLATVLLFMFILFAYNSRAGMLITAIISVPVYLVFVSNNNQRWRIIVAEAVFIAIPFILFFYRIGDVEDKFRDSFNAVTFSAILHYFPYGSGLGSFVHVYPMFDTLAAIGSFYVNNAHNDWFELLLELGITFPALLGVMAIVLVKAEWRSGLSPMAFLVVFALLVHSFVDYPLRTMAIGVIFAYAVGIITCKKPLAAELR